MSTGQQLSQIASSLQGSWAFQRVVISTTDKGFSCKTASNFWYLFPEWLFSWICSWVPDGFKEENRGTLDYFYKTFGHRRIDDISKRYGLNLSEKFVKSRSLSCYDVEEIFLGLGEVYRGDVKDLYLRVIGKGAVQSEVEKAAKEQCAYLKDKTFECLDKVDYDRLYSHLVPFEDVNFIFLNNAPRFGFRSNFAGGFGMRRQRIALCERIRRKGETFKLNKWRAWVAKSMLKRRQQKQGLLIPHPQGYYEVHGELGCDGESLLFLKARVGGMRSIVKAQGTRTSLLSSEDARLSVLDGFSEDPGMRGYRALEESLLYMLGRTTQKPKNFDQLYYRGLPPEEFHGAGLTPGEFDAVAFSLGCAQLSHFIQRHPDIFKVAMLMCPLGISEQECLGYSAVTDGPELIYGVEVYDFVHSSGWGKLRGENLEKVKLMIFGGKGMTRKEKAALFLDPPLVPEGLFWIFVEILKGFFGAHGRHSSVVIADDEEGCELFELSNPDDAPVVEAFLTNGDWESVRKAIRNSGIAWKEFYDSNSEKAAARLRVLKTAFH